MTGKREHRTRQERGKVGREQKMETAELPTRQKVFTISQVAGSFSKGTSVLNPAVKRN